MFIVFTLKLLGLATSLALANIASLLSVILASISGSLVALNCIFMKSLSGASNILDISSLVVSVPLKVYDGVASFIAFLASASELFNWAGAIATPATPSNNISSPANSWPATSIPAVSPRAPPAASTAVVAAKPLAANLKPALAPLTPLVNILPPTPPLTKPVKPSIAPIVKPLPPAFHRRSLISSGFSSTSLMSSLLSGLPPFSITFSLRSSAKVADVSIAVIAPEKAPDTAPLPAPTAPDKKANGPVGAANVVAKAPPA